MEPYIHKVQYYETDRMCVTHHSNYIRWMEEARVEYLEQLGWGYDRLEAEGIVSPVVKVECEFKRTTTFPDQIAVEARVTSYNGVKLGLSYTMFNQATGELAAAGRSLHCFLNSEGRPISLKREFPELDRRLREQLVPEEPRSGRKTREKAGDAS